MSDSNSHKPFAGNTLIYSNRPPSAGSSGGAQMVIEATNPTWWVGPESVDNRLWNVMDEQERQTITVAQGPNNPQTNDYQVLTFPAPKALEDAQYKTISNEVLWPIAHSMKPNAKESLEQIEDAYFNGYLPYNELANNALRTFTEEKGLTANDRVWVHDYQCDNVPGMIYSRHIPWPSLEFLEETTFKSETGKDVPVIETSFFRDLIELGGNRALSTF
ncbi:MAG: trehalose-6-phosphate synthase [Alphaproteobacteria bacterium]|nr:trehalose-6-phosphate synthase [Alphaproteobacteria bacterium]